MEEEFREKIMGFGTATWEIHAGRTSETGFVTCSRPRHEEYILISDEFLGSVGVGG